MRHGGDTSCVEVGQGAESLIIDAGSGIRELGVKLARGGPRRVHLFITHTHWDHIQGFPFFAPLFIPGFEVVVYGASGFGKDLESIFRGQVDRDYFPVQFEDMRAKIDFVVLSPEPVQVGGLSVTWEYTQHPQATIGYKVEVGGRKVAYASDDEFLIGYHGSPLEIAPLRTAIENPNFVILTPGVRPRGAALNDQKRVMTPGDAVKAGADYLVIGRPLTGAENPAAAAQKISEEIEQACREISKKHPRIQGICHSIAYANYEDGIKPFHETNRDNFLQSINISCYSLIAICNELKDILDPDGSVVTISISTTRMASENYGYMAPVKAALNSSIVFLAKSFSQFSMSCSERFFASHTSFAVCTVFFA